MDKKDKYIKKIESNLKKYKDKISKIDSIMTDYKSSDRKHLLSESKNIKEKLKSAEGLFEKLKNSSQQNYEEIKESSSEVFDAVNDAFGEFSTLLTMDQLNHVKEDIVDYGHDKIFQIEDCIKKNPLTCAAYALGIGFLIGILTRSK